MTAAKDSLDTGLIVTIGALLVILTFALILLVQGWFYQAQTEEYVRKVVEPRSAQLSSALADMQESLHTYRVLDPEAGRVGIPIERAMELVVREGLETAR
ncbi:MAG TPA: hypothetical protein PLL30_02905 [Candidatus Krumholzibacteria bacterium]|nr:hypothetical protein [Candidatus Krumholzibacteria bacterium]HPD70720.1 hypothetical protein [Candidatus Krumholzibacteria bacterium]HRY39580.1 hypothetical protein [Candidatus Krumholzibacteria bacterium]